MICFFQTYFAKSIWMRKTVWLKWHIVWKTCSWFECHQQIFLLMTRSKILIIVTQKFFFYMLIFSEFYIRFKYEKRQKRYSWSLCIFCLCSVVHLLWQKIFRNGEDVWLKVSQHGHKKRLKATSFSNMSYFILMFSIKYILCVKKNEKYLIQF